MSHNQNMVTIPVSRTRRPPHLNMARVLAFAFPAFDCASGQAGRLAKPAQTRPHLLILSRLIASLVLAILHLLGILNV